MNEAAQAHLAKGFALRRRHETEAAFVAIEAAARLAPDDPHAALALARIRYETWRPSARQFERAQALDPANGGIARDRALALHAEGQTREAEALLDSVVAAHPEWIDGHKTLAMIRTTGGSEGAPFDASFARACAARPDHAGLRLAWFHALAGGKSWDAARTVLEEGEVRFGATRGLRLARAFLASESDEASRDPAIFAAVDDVDDPGLDLARARFWLRLGDPAKAEAIAAARLDGPAARMFWPYLSLAWRLMDDPRADWLDVGPDVRKTVELGADGLIELAAVLRHLLVMQAPYHEQSVRGGIQTSRHLFFNPDPTIQRLASNIRGAVSDYVAALPPHLPKHPLLALPRDRDVRFEGSWSVLLRGAGFHAPHTHMMGWISSAFYVAIPDAEGDQGSLAFGAPPPELGLDLRSVQTIRPAPGRLVLFPSTTWHGTLPFDAGERLSIAFDVALPD
jgi:Putative 2OG-Fe(II) oxygenase